jgi:hypothetical protein
LGEPYSVILRRDEGSRFSQTVVREPGFNPHPSHPLEGTPHGRPWKARDVDPVHTLLLIYEDASNCLEIEQMCSHGILVLGYALFY